MHYKVLHSLALPCPHFILLSPAGLFFLLWKHTNCLQATVLLLKFQNGLFSPPGPLPWLTSFRDEFRCPLLMHAFLNHCCSHPLSTICYPITQFSPHLVSPITVLAIVLICFLSSLPTRVLVP